MNILVTGGAGFIGSNLAAALLREGHNVTVLDNFHTGSEENLETLNVKLVRGGAGDVDKLDVGKPDVIFHQGIYSSMPMYRENPRLVAKVIDDFIVLMEFARKSDSEVIFASTSSLYNGYEPPHPEDRFILVSDFYTEARYALERLAELYHKFHGMKVMGLRYFSVYGPNERSKGKYANLISQFLWAMMNGEAPVIYGNGTQSRDFTYVDDVVHANILAMKSTIRLGFYNVGTGKSCSLNDVVDIINRKLGTSVRPQYVDNKIKNYVYATRGEMTKAKRDLGFEAKVSIEQGIDKLIALEKTGNPSE